MGYCIQLVDQKFTIKKENKAKALEAIRALAKQTSKMSGGSWGPGGQERSRHFSWVTTDDFVLAKTLEAALEAWRYEALFHHKDEKNEGERCAECSAEAIPALGRLLHPLCEGCYVGHLTAPPPAEMVWPERMAPLAERAAQRKAGPQLSLFDAGGSR